MNKGFTFIEVLIVLLIVTVITSVTIAGYSNIQREQSFLSFYQQLEKDVMTIQLQAITTNQTTEIVFTNNGTRYVARQSFTKTLFTRDIPSEIVYRNEGTLTSVSFNPNGTIVKFGTLVFENGQKKEYVKFYIGKGRMELAE
ncbi:competence type IV pilus minor pilin ComGD [Paenisporosarcina cavernae]|uniref:Prepilin-type N-terminal cleavage/methylation domain-containing protein n=1 Tax=Paenisporosarcina cavernae TaxID=2320858 RepID=A0A385YVG9_9BACL|nr:competence type IV pilus minor pilin ComGD [Paenisporosarcina cavernae]AYC29562.1 prepilin-type N-terminal cleavage/methylation domain-containing protein [Paenisporosarcina cavernae]